GRVAASGFGCELGPVVAPTEEAGIDVDAVGCLEQVIDAIGAVGARLTAPEELAQASGLGEARADTKGSGSGQSGGSHKELTAIDFQSHVCPPVMPALPTIGACRTATGSR